MILKRDECHAIHKTNNLRWEMGQFGVGGVVAESLLMSFFTIGMLLWQGRQGFGLPCCRFFCAFVVVFSCLSTIFP